MKSVLNLERWNAALAQRHELAAAAAVLYPDGSTDELKVDGGVVDLDANAATRGQLQTTIGGEDWVPKLPGDPLAPYGNEIQVWRGLKYPEGDTEMVSLGIFGIEEADVDDEGVTTSITAYDRSMRISRSKFQDPYQVTSGTPIGEAIVNVGLSRWAEMPYNEAAFDALTTTMPLVTAAEGEDPWEFMLGFATALGRVLYFDGDGILDIKPYTVTDAVAELREGQGGVLVKANRNWSRTDTFNIVIATGENSESGAVYRGVAQDMDPTSPTNVGGPFGPVPEFYSSPHIQSDAQAQDAAQSKLDQELGTLANVSFGIAPNPALEPDDSVWIQRERVGINELHVIDSLSIELGGEAMGGTTRQRTVQV